MGQVDAAVARLEAALRARPRALLPDQVYSDAAARVAPPRVRSLDPDELDRVLEALRWAEDDPELRRMEDVIGKILAEGGEAALQEIGVDTKFRADSPETRAWLHDKTIKFAQQVDDTTIEELRSELLAGKAEGETYAELAARVEDVFDGRRQNALTVARTECLPGSVLVNGAVILAAYRRWYDGPMVTVITASGRQFSATPNHPMLTSRGWIGAGDLQLGNDLVRDSLEENRSALCDVDIEASPSALSDVFDSLKAKWACVRKGSCKPDFHGDGMDGDVDVLSSDWELRIGAQAAVSKPTIDLLLADPDLPRPPTCLQCERLIPIDKRCRFCSSSEFDSSREKAAANTGRKESELLGDCMGALPGPVEIDDIVGANVIPKVMRDVGVSLDHEQARITSASRDPGALSAGVDPGGSNAKSSSDHLCTQTGTIEFDRVTSVLIRPFRGHVFNLSTDSGYYTINGGFFTGNTVGAANFGRMAAFLDADLEKHFWTTQRDQFVREEHQALEGETVAIGESFSNGLRFPGDTENGSPDQVCNCRCDVAPVIPGVTERSASYIDAQWRAFAARVAAGERLVARQWLRMLRAQGKRALAELAKAAR